MVVMIVIVVTSPVTLESSGGYELFIFGGTPPYSILLNGEPASISSNTLLEGDYTVTVIDANGCVIDENFVIDTTVNIAESNRVKLSVYPTPVQFDGQLTIYLDPLYTFQRLLVFDDAGKLCLEKNIAPQQPTLTLSPGTFTHSTGVFTFIFVGEEQSIERKRIVVSR